MAVPCAELLSSLKSRHGSYAVLGNHDLGTDEHVVTEALQHNGIAVLKNRSIPIEWQGGRLWLAGVEDVMYARPDLDRTLQNVAPQEPVVLLAHEPDFADEAARYKVDLQLSGHSHGGQIRLPFAVSLYLPPLARKYPWGMRRVGPLALYTNVGIGTIQVPMRWNCSPEVTLITLQNEGRHLEIGAAQIDPQRTFA
jgi:predicted MPP superfamily phosphohydrolase